MKKLSLLSILFIWSLICAGQQKYTINYIFSTEEDFNIPLGTDRDGIASKILFELRESKIPAWDGRENRLLKTNEIEDRLKVETEYVYPIVWKESYEFFLLGLTEEVNADGAAEPTFLAIYEQLGNDVETSIFRPLIRIKLKDVKSLLQKSMWFHPLNNADSTDIYSALVNKKFRPRMISVNDAKGNVLYNTQINKSYSVNFSEPVNGKLRYFKEEAYKKTDTKNGNYLLISGDIYPDRLDPHNLPFFGYETGLVKSIYERVLAGSMTAYIRDYNSGTFRVISAKQAKENLAETDSGIYLEEAMGKIQSDCEAGIIDCKGSDTTGLFQKVYTEMIAPGNYCPYYDLGVQLFETAKIYPSEKMEEEILYLALYVPEDLPANYKGIRKPVFYVSAEDVKKIKGPGEMFYHPDNAADSSTFYDALIKKRYRPSDLYFQDKFGKAVLELYIKSGEMNRPEYWYNDGKEMEIRVKDINNNDGLAMDPIQKRLLKLFYVYLNTVDTASPVPASWYTDPKLPVYHQFITQTWINAKDKSNKAFNKKDQQFMRLLRDLALKGELPVYNFENKRATTDDFKNMLMLKNPEGAVVLDFSGEGISQEPGFYLEEKVMITNGKESYVPQAINYMILSPDSRMLFLIGRFYMQDINQLAKTDKKLQAYVKLLNKREFKGELSIVKDIYGYRSDKWSENFLSDKYMKKYFSGK